MDNYSNTPKTAGKKLASAGSWLYRFGVVSSAILALMQVVYDVGNRFGLRKEETTASAEQSGLLKYESPAFRMFGNMFSQEALAGMTPALGVVSSTSGFTPAVPAPAPSPGHR
jgi:hypothetical protein